MIGKDDQKTDGANPSAEKETEFRDDSRHSAPLSQDGETAVSAAADGDAATPAGGRMTREEMESQYRNDPRFTMLFSEKDESEKKNAHAIVVGGIRLTPKRLLILGGFFLIILFCLGICFYYALKDIGKYRDYARASDFFQSGDYESARDLFLKVVGEDPNKEDAVAALADIYKHFGDWNNEAFFRQRLVRLNPLNEEYFRNFMESAFRARNFGVIYSRFHLQVMENAQLSPDNGALYLISAIHTGHMDGGKVFYDAQKNQNPDYFSETERGRFAELLLKSAEETGPRNSEQIMDLSRFLDGVKDPQVRFETIDLLLFFLSNRSDEESKAMLEKLLREAAEVNDFVGAPLLANYYFSHYRFNDVVDVCEKYLKTKANASMPILYGESCLLSGHPELIPPLSEKMRKVMGRQSKIIFSYLDALTAFSEEDYVLLRRLLMETGATIETPLYSLMKLQVALSSDSPKEIRHALATILRGRPFLDFQQRARTAALSYLMKKVDEDLVSNPELLNDCAEIAQLIQSPSDDNSFFRRIILLDQFMRNVLKETDIRGALAMFPGDVVLLRIAAEFYLRYGQPSRAMDCIAEYNAHEDPPDRTSMAILRIQALDQMGRLDEAEKEFRTIVERDDPDGVLLPYYYVFCVENNCIDSLKTLSSWIESLPSDSGKRAALPFIRAEILFAEGKRQEALDLFKKSDASNPRYVFHAASRLAEAGQTDAALARYLSIRNTFWDKSLLNIRLSELYAKKGDKDDAVACARTAWQENPNDQRARLIYGKCLFDAGQYAEAINVFKFPQYQAAFPDEMLKLWAEAMRRQIKADFDDARYVPVRENIKHLLIYFPEDEFGLEYDRKMEIIRRQSKNLGDDK